MKRFRLIQPAAAVVSLAVVSSAHAQNGPAVVLPTIDVTTSRLYGAGITGTATTTVTREMIERSPAQDLPGILAQQTGVQVQHLFGSSRTAVDLRGFGAFAPSNVLILVNGRRYQDFDLQGFDFSIIPLNSIERIEITRGNSGAVLYGDGAVGGVINIVTRRSITTKGVAGRVDGAIGSYGYEQERASAGATFGPWSTALFESAIGSQGYRRNSKLTQTDGIAEINYADHGWSGYLNVIGDRQRQDLPGPLPSMPNGNPFTFTSPRESNTPYDWAAQQSFAVTTGFTAPLAAGSQLIVDGGIRRKFQQSTFYDYFPAPTFTYDLANAAPSNYVNTGLTTTSLTPRLDVNHQLFGLSGHLLSGVDFYNTQYDSDRSQASGLPTIHHYNIRQTSFALYAMDKEAVTSALDLSFGGRLQRTSVKATDDYDPGADPNAFFYASNPQAPSLSQQDWQYAAHIGLDYRVDPVFTLFARAARAFRVPNADERIGAGNPYGTTAPVTFDLKTQTSHDVEGGVRADWDGVQVQSSVYLMDLNNEIHYLPAEFRNINLDPTRRTGWETSASYRLSDSVRLRGGVAYTRAVFREGPYAGNAVPLVSLWSGNAGLTWDIVPKLLVFDVAARFWSSRRMDNDQPNWQPLIPANATVDVKLSGGYERLFWSVAVENLLDRQYFDYAVASAATAGQYNAYPQAGRTVMLRVGATF